jgi:hypothetical protein
MSLGLIAVVVSVLISLASGIVLYLLLPADVWSPASIYAAILACLSLGVVLPIGRSRDVNLGMLGPLFVFSGLFSVTSILALVISLSGFGTAAAVANVANTAFGLVGYLILLASSKVIAKNVERGDSQGFQTMLARELLKCVDSSNDIRLKQEITALRAELRFIPRALSGEAVVYQTQAENILEQLRSAASSNQTDRAFSSLNELKNVLHSYSEEIKFSKNKA